MTAKFDFASFHRSAQRREQISATDSRATVFLKRAEVSRAMQKADGQSVKALFNFAGCGGYGLGF